MKKKNKLVYRYHVEEERPEGVVIDKKCACGCGENIIHSFNRIKRKQEPPNYRWGHHGRFTLKKYMFKKGSNKIGGGIKSIHHSKKTRKKMSEARKGRNIPGMFQKGHKRTQGKKHPRYGMTGELSPNWGKKYKKHKVKK